MVAHCGGVTLSQPLGSTFALVEAKDAQGVGIENQTGVRIDPFGYAVVPQSVPYRVNLVALNPQDFDTFLDVPNAVADTVPTRGAITRVRFDTFRGYSVLIHTTLADGSYPPLGAQLYRASGISNGRGRPGRRSLRQRSRFRRKAADEMGRNAPAKLRNHPARTAPGASAGDGLA